MINIYPTITFDQYLDVQRMVKGLIDRRAPAVLENRYLDCYIHDNPPIKVSLEKVVKYGGHSFDPIKITGWKMLNKVRIYA